MKQFIATAAIFAATVSAIPVWQQCGGQDWTGSGSCDSGSTCVKLNDCKSHCVTIANIIRPLTLRRLLPMPARQRDNHDSGDQHSHLSHYQQDHFGLVGHHYESLYHLRLD